MRKPLPSCQFLSRRRLPPLVLLALVWPVAGSALELGPVQVVGIGGEAEQNVSARLSLNQQLPEQELTEARLSYLLRRAPGEVLTALEPFGFYDATVNIDTTRTGERVDVRVRILPGRPVQVASSKVRVEGDGGDDKLLKSDLKAFRPAAHEILDHRRYEASKATIERRLNARGYFDAELTNHQIEVERSTFSADIDLSWASGARYDFGSTEFSGSHIEKSLLSPLLPYKQGEPYDQTELARLHQRLVDLDYFGFIDIQPRPEDATDKQVPVAVALTPAKRSRYTAGVSYGTDSGPALRLGLERRYVNSRGHKFNSELSLGTRKSSIAAQYRIPTFENAWPGWWTIGSSLRHEAFGSDGIFSDIIELVGSRNGRWHEMDVSAEMHVRQERYNPERSTLVYPLLRVKRTVADAPLYPDRGYSWDVSLAHGNQAFGSDIAFTQLTVAGRYIHSLGERRRLLLRGQAGHTVTSDNENFPPSLRFYAGGDRSVRGYGYQEISPRFEGKAIGGLTVITASVELEQMLTPTWGVAAFVDAGDAYSGNGPDPRVGAGLGLRWRSPVGPVRVDLGFGLDDPDHSVQLHLNIGPDFTP